ncbi:hypothetical protein [Cellulomonas sp. URHD0024]|uniref:hypothetical protein n=1 Tax=Cellulomonas sp. URHD0024 TaxID=1302620 RepID=UPI0004019074|nr:hypothetical protein [Cellulomonas sp. URHD0024]
MNRDTRNGADSSALVIVTGVFGALSLVGLALVAWQIARDVPAVRPDDVASRVFAAGAIATFAAIVTYRGFLTRFARPVAVVAGIVVLLGIGVLVFGLASIAWNAQ